MPQRDVPTGVKAIKRRRPESVVIKADWAKLDPSLFGLAMFRPIKRGDRPRVEMEGQFAGEKIEVVSAFALGADDLSVLLAVLTLAGQKSRGILLLPASFPKHREAIKDLEPSGEALDAEHIALDTTVYEILSTAGMPTGGDHYTHFKQIMKRLRHVSYTREVIHGNQSVTFSSAQETLLYYRTGEDGYVHITLSERLSKALLRAPFDMLWMPDYRSLNGAVARIALTRLAVLVSPGETMSYKLDDLVGIVYGESLKSMTSQQIRDRRRGLRKALDELNQLDSWLIKLDHRAIVFVTNLRRRGKLVEANGLVKEWALV